MHEDRPLDSAGGDAEASGSSQVCMTPTKHDRVQIDVCRGAVTPVHRKLTWNRCKVIVKARDYTAEVKLSLVTGETVPVGRGRVLLLSDDRTA